MSLNSSASGESISARLTDPKVGPYADIEWKRTPVQLRDQRTGEINFEHEGVEVPVDWTLTSTTILAQKYLAPGEDSIKQVADRVTDSIVAHGLKSGYFDAPSAATFSDELKRIIVTQRAAFNSPVWFNIGVPGVKQQASACFILGVGDSMDSILNWYTEEAKIFQRGSGAGVNLSDIRGSAEAISKGGIASGPVTFMRGADASAGTIKSGGTTRRAAKMVLLDVDHPDVEEFIWCKAIEERKARDLTAAGWDMEFNGPDAFSVQYQNANNSVRLTDEFLQAVENDEDWALTARTDGSVIKKLPAKALFSEIAKAAWESADPGVQFTTTINRWHTAANTGPITASNPCSEYLHLDNSACNLASLNLLTFLNEDGSFDIDIFQHVARIMFIAQDILVDLSDYPTKKIDETTRRFRQLGLGYANLGAMLMAMGLPYDSDEARSWCSAITALMGGTAYKTSTELAQMISPFEGFESNREHMLDVLERHEAAAKAIPTPASTLSNLREVVEASQRAWEAAVAEAHVCGVRNAQATVLAPTGTIGFLMGCDTTGIEPDYALVKHKSLSDGSFMPVLNDTVRLALHNLGYSWDEVSVIADHIEEHGDVEGATLLDEAHHAVFSCAVGYKPIHHMGHVYMMAAAQPFLSGAISKTINCPQSATPADIEDVFMTSWRLGLKAVAVYRDGSKIGQPLSASKSAETTDEVEEVSVPTSVEDPSLKSTSSTYEFSMGGFSLTCAVTERSDGSISALSLTGGKYGSTLAGLLNQIGVTTTIGLSAGVPISGYIESFIGSRFEPSGFSNDPDFRIAKSLLDLVGRRLAADYLDVDERMALGVETMSERAESQADDGNALAADDAATVVAVSPDAPMCGTCGSMTTRSGSCYACPSCGETTGCS